MKWPPYPEYKPSGVEWFKEVPEHWAVQRGRFCMDVNPRSNRLRTLRGEDEVSFVPMEAVGEYGGLRLEQTRTIDEVGSGYTEFDDGDVVVAKITPCWENGKGALAAGLLNGAAFGTTELHVLRAASTLDQRFLFYVTVSRWFRSTGEGEMYGAGGQKRVPPEFCENARIPLPQIGDQRAIADFLDLETAKIDTLVAKKRTLIERLKEKRMALISRTVTRGLPPDAAWAAGLDPHPKLKPSGIDWLGDVREHWNALPFTKYVAEKSDYRGKTPEKTQDGVFLVTAKNVRMGFIDYECSQEYVAKDEYDEIMRRGLPKKGDILFTTEAPLGNVALVDREDVALAQRIIRFRMHPEHFRERFALYGMMSDSFQIQLQSLSTGSTAEGLKASKLPILRLVAPPVSEQDVIADFLDRETARVDGMIAKIETAIERLQEYRTALITASVTGKIDVREAMA
jgi:type I restriction enzyme S subunit